MWILEKLCMLCLRSNIELKSIYTQDANNTFIIEKLTYAIEPLDNNLSACSMYICDICDKLLNNIYNYKQQCVKNIFYISNYNMKLNPSNTQTSCLSVSLNKIGITETEENEVNSEDIIANVGYIKVEDEITIDYDLFESQVQLNDLQNEVKNKIDYEGNIANIHTEEVNDNHSTDINAKNIETEINKEGFIEICADVSAETTTDRNELLKCVICQNGFKNKQELTAHMKVHKSGKYYICDVCKKLFKQKEALVTHLRTHTGEKPFKCSVCKKGFKQLNDLKRHLRIHTGEEPFKCNVCNKAFKQLCNLKGHLRIHTGEEPFKCSVCNKGFKQLGNLKTHFRIHSEERPFKCKICKKGFKQLGYLKIHLRIHTQEKPFKCNVCNKAFNQLGSLKMHLKIHNEEKPFKCSICNKSFVVSNILKRHLKIHSGERLFKCTVCKKTFKESSGLKRHLRIHT